MSTTFGIITKSGERPIARRVGSKNSAEMWFTDELAEMLPDNTPVKPLDNSAQGIYTIGDIKNHILNQTKMSTIEMLEKKQEQRRKFWHTQPPKPETSVICRMHNGYIKMCHWTGEEWLDMWKDTLEGEVIEWMYIPYD